MLERKYFTLLDHETVDLKRKGISDWSDFAEVTVAGDDLAPAAPSGVTATQVAEGIKLEWTNPTTNADGTTCNDLRWIKIYYKSTTGVSKTSNDGSYVLTGHVGDDQSFTDRIAAQTTRYYVLTALDKSGNESVESSEVIASAGDIAVTSDIPDDATGLIFDDSSETIDGIVIGDGILGIVFQIPSWKAFDHYRLWFQYTDDDGTTWYDKNGNAGSWSEIKSVSRFGYVHKGLNKTWAYRYKATVVATDGTESSVADTAGGSTMKPDASNNNDIIGVLIFAENIVATNEVRASSIKAGTITADRLAFTAYDLNSNTLDDVTDGTNYAKVLKTDISAGHILLSETVGDLDDITDGTNYGRVAKTDISAGHIKLSETIGSLDDIADGSTYGKVAITDISAGHITAIAQNASININDSTFGNQGIQLQYNGGTPRAYIGNGSDKYFEFDGTNVAMSGSITIAGGSGLFNLDEGDLVSPVEGHNLLANPNFDKGDFCWVLTDGTSEGVFYQTVPEEFASNGESQPFYPSSNSPAAYYYNGKTYVVWQGSDLDPYINYYDHSTHAWGTAVKVGTNPLSSDDHGAPSVMVDDDGYIHVLYGCHNSALKYKRSTNAEDISAWTTMTDLTTGQTSYPRWAKDSSGKLYAFYQGSSGTDPEYKQKLSYKQSTDGGDTWGSEVTLIDTESGYCYSSDIAFDAANNRMHVAWAWWDTTKRLNIYHAYFYLTDTHMYAMDGTDLGTSISKSEMDDYCKIFDSGTYETTIPVIHLDSSGNPHILCQVDTADGWRHKHIYWTGSAWSSLTTITSAGHQHNYSDFIINSATDIDAYLTTAAEGTRSGDIEKWKWDGSSWSLTAIILSKADVSYDGLNFPHAVVNGVDDLAVVFCDTDPNVYTHSDLSLFAVNASGKSLVEIEMPASGVRTIYQATGAGVKKSIAVSPGEIYEFGGLARSSNGSCEAHIFVGHEGAWSDASTLATTWTSISGTYTVPADSYFLQFAISPRAAAGSASYTNLYLRRIDFNGVSGNDMAGWAYSGDHTYIDGGKIYTHTVTAEQINVTNLSAISADIGTITAGKISLESGKIELGANVDTSQMDGIVVYEGGNPRVRIGEWLATSEYGIWLYDNTGALKAKLAGTSSYIDGVLLKDASITDAKISDLTFDKITAGSNTASLTIGSGGYIQSSNYSAGSAGFKINGAGDAEFNDVTVRGTIISDQASQIVHWSGATVFNDAAPTSWTLLDLSSYVGSHSSFVILEVQNGGATSENIRTRRYGSGWTSNDAVDDFPQAFGTRAVNNGNGFVFAVTDSSGRIEWDSDQGNGTKLILLAYIN